MVIKKIATGHATEWICLQSTDYRLHYSANPKMIKIVNMQVWWFHLLEKKKMAKKDVLEQTRPSLHNRTTWWSTTS